MRVNRYALYFLVIISYSFASGHASDLKIGLYSAAVPGLGQLILYKDTAEKKILRRSLCYFAIESAGIFSSILFNNKYKNKVNDYKNYADSSWDFGRWIYKYEDFKSSEISYIWENNDNVEFTSGDWMDIGSGSHSIKFTIGNNNNIIATTSDSFLEIKEEIIDFLDSGGEDLYSEFGIQIRKDQHFYENIGKYNEYYSGWSDADIINTEVVVTAHGYETPRSPIKTEYLNKYNDAEELSDISETSIACIYFNHFISMIDAFVLSRKYNGDVVLSSSTVYGAGYKNKTPIGIKINLKFNL